MAGCGIRNLSESGDGAEGSERRAETCQILLPRGVENDEALPSARSLSFSFIKKKKENTSKDWPLRCTSQGTSSFRCKRPPGCLGLVFAAFGILFAVYLRQATEFLAANAYPKCDPNTSEKSSRAPDYTGKRLADEPSQHVVGRVEPRRASSSSNLASHLVFLPGPLPNWT